MEPGSKLQTVVEKFFSFFYVLYICCELLNTCDHKHLFSVSSPPEQKLLHFLSPLRSNSCLGVMR